MTQQMQGMNNDLGSVQGRFAEQDQAEQEDGLKMQGYEQGLKESAAMDATAMSTSEIPPELLEEMSTMSDSELEQFLTENPELASKL